MKTPSRLAPIWLIALCGVAAAADPTCDEATETLFTCFQRIAAASDAAAPALDASAAATAVDDAKATAKEETNEKLADAKPSADSGGAATAVTLTDLAPLFDALGILSSDDTTGDQLALNLNFLLPVQDVENRNTQLQLLVNTQPKPFDDLVQAFDETIRETRKDELQKKISAFGDAQLNFKWSLVNSRFGRDYRVLREFLGPIYDGARAQSLRSAGAVDSVGRIRRFQNTLTGQNVSFATANGTLIKDLPPAVKAQVTAATIDAAQARANITQEFRLEIARANLDKLTDLVDQQPQLLFSLSHNFRDEIVGPEETSANVTWEMTRHNIGNFLRTTGKSCAKDQVGLGTEVYADCVSQLERYLAEDFDQQWRFKLQASYKRVDAVNYTFVDDDVSLSIPKTKRIEASIGAGRNLGGKTNLGRLDFELSYDSNVDNDTKNKDRLKAAVTLTHRVGDMDVPLSLVYANRNEFLGEVDHQISMHVGIKFRSAP